MQVVLKDMDETLRLITQGCKMAKDLEANLPNMGTQPEYLLNSCTDIINIFIRAKESINSNAQMVVSGPIASGVGGLLSSSQTPAMYLLQAQHLLAGAPGSSRTIAFDPKMKGVLMQDDQDLEGGAGGTLAEVVAHRMFPGSRAPEVAATTSGPRGGASSPSRPRRRVVAAARRVVRALAPQIGNTEIPPEDGFTWRKYGQKAILNSRFPRSYFRCTHQKLYKCPAKKQVQRLDNDPSTFEITYLGDHTCHLSSTAPSVPPPPLLHNQLILQQDPILHQQISTATASVNLGLLNPSSPSTLLTSQWLSMDISTVGQRVGTSNIMNLASGSITNAAAAAAAPSGFGIPFGQGHINVEYLPEQPRVADMADAMFNSGSSSNNSIDVIFSSTDNK